MDETDPEIHFREDQREPDMGQGDVDENYGENANDEHLNRIPDHINNSKYQGDFRQNKNTPLAGHRLYVKPESFNGTEDWEEYYSHFTNCAELGRWTEKDKILGLSANLRGPARIYYKGLSFEERSNYDVLIHKLAQRFGSSRQQNKWLSKFESRKRQSGESIALLGDDLRQMAQKAYRKLDCEAQEALALNQLYKTISLELKSKCIDKECETINEAVEIIERHEANFDSSDKKRVNFVRQLAEADEEYYSVHALKSEFKDKTPTPPSKETEQSILYKTLNERINQLEIAISRNQNTYNNAGFRNNNQRLCFHCNSPDHMIKNCPRRQGQFSRTNSQFRGNNPQAKSQGNFTTSI